MPAAPPSELSSLRRWNEYPFFFFFRFSPQGRSLLFLSREQVPFLSDVRSLFGSSRGRVFFPPSEGPPLALRIPLRIRVSFFLRLFPPPFRVPPPPRRRKDFPSFFLAKRSSPFLFLYSRASPPPVKKGNYSFLSFRTGHFPSYCTGMFPFLYPEFFQFLSA